MFVLSMVKGNGGNDDAIEPLHFIICLNNPFLSEYNFFMIQYSYTWYIVAPYFKTYLKK